MYILESVQFTVELHGVTFLINDYVLHFYFAFLILLFSRKNKPLEQFEKNSTQLYNYLGFFYSYKHKMRCTDSNIDLGMEVLYRRVITLQIQFVRRQPT